jgi:hypothetical protein
MYVGDTYPPIYLQVSDETGVLDLSTAELITIKFEGQLGKFSGEGTAVQPPLADPDTVHHWNCEYVFALGDTSHVDQYAIFVVVTWSAGPPAQVETFPTGDTLTVLAAPL